jgi:hypothetical protein
MPRSLILATTCTKKKNYIQPWYLDPDSQILHHFPTDDPETFDITSGSPYDDMGFDNKIVQINFNERFGYCSQFESAGFDNSIVKIDYIEKFNYCDATESAGFGNKLYAIQHSPDKFKYYTESYDEYSINNELINLNKTNDFEYVSAISSTYSVNNELINLTITQVEIEGYTREG